MTSIYMEPDVHIIVTQVPGVDGGGGTAGQIAQIEADLATLLARPQITNLDAVPDVNAPSPSGGDALVFDSATGEWQNREITGSIEAVRVREGAGNWPAVVAPVTNIAFYNGLTAISSGLDSQRAVVQPAYGITANTVAEGNHTHLQPWDEYKVIAPSGTLSTGTRMLTTGVKTNLNTSVTYRATAMLILDLRGEGTGAGYSLPAITIGGITVNRFGEVRTVAGVDREASMMFAGAAAEFSGVSSFTYGARIQFRSGDPVNVGAGVLIVTLRPNR